MVMGVLINEIFSIVETEFPGILFQSFVVNTVEDIQAEIPNIWNARSKSTNKLFIWKTITSMVNVAKRKLVN